MLDSHAEPATRLDPRSGSIHRRAQPTARRVVRADQNGADQEGCRQQRHLSGEARDRCAAGRSRSIIEPGSPRSCVATVPLQLRCTCERGSVTQDRRHRLAREIRPHLGQGQQGAPLPALGHHHRGASSPRWSTAQRCTHVFEPPR